MLYEFQASSKSTAAPQMRAVKVESGDMARTLAGSASARLISMQLPSSIGQVRGAPLLLNIYVVHPYL